MNNLEKAKEELKIKTETINAVLSKFPDADVYKNRWDREFYNSKTANSQTTNIEISRSCGCCTDAVIYAKPYLIINDIKIYSNPVEIYIGECDYDGLEHYDANWEKLLKNENISDIAINSIREKIKKANDKIEAHDRYLNELEEINEN